MRNGTVFLKPGLFLPALALAAVALFSSCQKTSTVSTDIGDWGKMTSFTGPIRTQAVSFTIGDTPYIGTGYNSFAGVRLTDFYKFDESHSQTWLQVADFPGSARSGAAGFSVNGMGYIVGGTNDGLHYLYDVWQYNPLINHWAQMNDVSVSVPRFTPTANAFAFALNNNGYIGGGIDSFGTYHNDVYKYDPTSDTWTTVASIGDKVSGAASFVYNGLAYVIGGATAGNSGSYSGYSPNLYTYNPTTGMWGKNRKIINDGDSSYEAAYGTNITRTLGAVILIHDTAYLTTGFYNGVLNTTWAYAISQDLWFQKTSLEGVARDGAIGFSIHNHGYIATGSDNGSNSFDDVWQFYPDAAQTNGNNY